MLRPPLFIRMAATSAEQEFLDVTAIEKWCNQKPVPQSISNELARHLDRQKIAAVPATSLMETASASAIGDQTSSRLSPGRRNNDGLDCSSTSPGRLASDSASRLHLHQTARDADYPKQMPKLLSRRYELCAVYNIMAVVHMLAELIETNDANFPSTGTMLRMQRLVASQRLS